MQAIALILAAGTSHRLGKNKLFERIGPESLIERAVRTFASHPGVTDVVVLCRKSDRPKVMRECSEFGTRNVHYVSTNSRSRQNTAYDGLRAIQRMNTHPNTRVLFHNVANPFVTLDDISRVLKATARYAGAAVGQPVHDTIKRTTKNGVVKETLDRDDLWRTQTPQCIRLDIALEAHTYARKHRIRATDDIMLVEKMGKKTTLVRCGEENFKITVPYDLAVANALIEQL